MQAGEVIDGRFQIERLAGSGGMGSVFRAHDLLADGPAAIKVIHETEPRDVARFDMEARLLAGLDHPGIVRYVTHGVTRAGEPFLAMEWLDGEDLGARLSRGRLTVEESVALVLAVAQALATAHARGVVHRDLKPNNLFLVGGALDRVKLLDFGLARMGLLAPRLTQPGFVLGTPGYMAPEQARGLPSLDARADVFALGAVLFECLIGRPAFMGEHMMAVLAKVLLEEPPLLRELRREVPVMLEALVACMLAKDPADRPTDAAEVAQALASLDASEARLWLSDATRAEALTRSEQRLLGIVAVGAPAEGAPAMDAALAAEYTKARRKALESAAAPFSARIEWLADGSMLALLRNAASASDGAAQAARCALRLRAYAPGAPIAIATGLGELEERLPVGQVIDRAATLVRAAAHWVLVDEVTAGLLDVRFAVVRGPDGLELHREEEIGAATRTLLGKPSPCVGRGRELRALFDLLDESVGESVARAVLVTGPPGIGKSRLRQEFVRVAPQRHAAVDVWLGRGDVMSAGSAFALAGSALRYAAAITGSEPIEERRRKLTARVARHMAEGEVARVAEFLGEMTGTPFPDAESVQLRAARRDARIMANQIQHAWGRLIAAECGAHPVVLVLEDLHWGDLASVKLFDAALRDHKGRPLVVAAFGRPATHDVFPKLWTERGLSEVRLGELTPRAAEQLARHALGDGAEPRVIAQLVERAGGHPFFLEELIRAVAEGHGEQLPQTVLAMVEARLSALPADARRVLRAASVFGDVFWSGGVEHLLGGAEEALRAGEWLDMLAEREVLQHSETSRFPGEIQYSFRHSLLREGAHATLTEADRTLGHGLAAEWLVQAGEGDAMRLAEHFERGGKPERAAERYLEAARQMLRANDLRGAIACAERGLGCGASGKLRAELLTVRSEIHAWGGDWVSDDACMDEALRQLAPGDPSWYTAMASKLISAALLEKPGVLFDALGTLCDVEPSPESVGHFMCALGLVWHTLAKFGRHDLTARCAARVEQVGNPSAGQDPLIRGMLQQMRSLMLQREADLWGSLQAAKASVANYEEAGDRRLAASVRLLVVQQYLDLGAYARAEKELRDLLRVDDDSFMVTTLGRNLLAHALAARGALEEARGLAVGIQDSPLARNNSYSEVHNRIALADILLRSGDFGAAEREARAAAQFLSVLPAGLASSAMTTLTAILAQALLQQERAGEALRVIEDAAAQRQMRGVGDYHEVTLHLTHAEALHATGDHARARAVLLQTRDLLLSRAAKIADPELRRSFLENVSENARVLALAAALQIGAG